MMFTDSVCEKKKEKKKSEIHGPPAKKTEEIKMAANTGKKKAFHALRLTFECISC